MRRTLALLLLVAGLLAGGAAAVAAAADHGVPPALGAELTLCATGPEAAERVAEFTGAMPALAGTERMAMRFDLLERRAGRTEFRRVTAPGLGVWERSAPGRAGFVFTKRVEALAARSAYRATVRFRWYDARGRVQRSTARRTPVCGQPDPLPQLRIVALAPAADGHRATVVNLGGGPAGPFGVAVTVDGTERPAVTVPGLAAGEQAEVALPAPRCTPGSEVRAVVDPAGRVVERDERDNALATICAR